MEIKDKVQQRWRGELTNRELYNRIQSSVGRTLEDKIRNLELDVPKPLEGIFQRYCASLKVKWNAIFRKEERLFLRYSKWLDAVWKEKIPRYKTPIDPKVPKDDIPKDEPRVVGRPPKPLKESAGRSKRRKIKKKYGEADTEELYEAAMFKMQRRGKRSARSVIDAALGSASSAKKLKSALAVRDVSKSKQKTKENALRLLVDMNMSKNQYQTLRSDMKNTFPPYNDVRKAKEEAYPEGITITATEMEVPLQALLEHTVGRLLLDIKKDLTDCDGKITLISKWGCDGATTTNYKLTGHTAELSATQHIFQSCMVPLQLVDESGILWKNPTHSSPRFCRPIRIRLVKEDVETTKEEIGHINAQLEAMQGKTTHSFNGMTVEVHHVMALTMVDGRVCNAAADNYSTMRCYICGATPSLFNQLEEVRERKINEGTLQFGLSVLHARIRLLETILHLAYRIPVQKWQMRSEEDKQKYKKQKRRIQEKLRTHMGILVDVPKADVDNTNDGNTSRRFFKDPKLASEISMKL